MNTEEIIEVLKALDRTDYVEDYVTETYTIDFPYERASEKGRMTLYVGADSLSFVESMTNDNSAYRLKMSDGYEGIAKLVKHFGIDVTDTQNILNRLFDKVANLVGSDGDLEKVVSLLKELNINFEESY